MNSYQVQNPSLTGLISPSSLISPTPQPPPLSIVTPGPLPSPSASPFLVQSATNVPLLSSVTPAIVASGLGKSVTTQSYGTPNAEPLIKTQSSLKSNQNNLFPIQSSVPSTVPAVVPSSVLSGSPRLDSNFVSSSTPGVIPPISPVVSSPVLSSITQVPTSPVLSSPKIGRAHV